MDDLSSPFRHAQAYAGDPILSLNALCFADPRPGKINLSIGVYTDASGRIPILRSVAKAAADTWSTSRPYLPMEGDAHFCRGLEELVFGSDSPTRSGDCVASIQTVGCTGALSIAADLLHSLDPNRLVLLSRPGWDNHHDLFRRAGFATVDYPWCDEAGSLLGWPAMTGFFEAAPDGSIVVVQAAGHNPTGLDMAPDQQAEFLALMRRKRHVVVFDLSYQGLVRGIDADAAFVRRAALEVPCLVATSLSKNFSLYGERVGALSAVCSSPAERDRLLGQMRKMVRRSYSSPPAAGAQIVGRILGDGALSLSWRCEVDAMRQRMFRLRSAFAKRLEAHGTTADAIRVQAGMFAWTGLSTASVHRLRDEHAIYLLDSGRLCVAGLNPELIDRVAQAIAAVTVDE